MTSQSELLEFYSTSGVMTEFGDHASAIDDLPRDIGELATMLQGLLIHEHIAPEYGVTLTDERRSEVHTRSTIQLLDVIADHEAGPLRAPRDLDKRVVGNCRDFSMLLTAVLRRQGVPARARCGFGTYFDTQSHVDHWVCEYWNQADSRWVMVDAQIDSLQRDLFKPDFDLMDVPRDRFLVAGEAWKQARSGETDPEKFGIMDMRGYWFIAGNVIRDIASLNKVEMLPWDVWGPMLQPGEASSEEMALYDRLAELSREPDGNFDSLRAVYQNEGLSVPPVVFNAVRDREETWREDS